MYQMGAAPNVLLTSLLLLLIKLFTVVLVVAVGAGVVIWIKNSFFKESNSNLFQPIKNDPAIKTILTAALVIVGVFLVLGLLNSLVSPGINGGWYGHMGGYGYAYNGFNSSNIIGSLIILLIKVLSFVLVIALAGAAVAYVKKQYDNESKNNEPSAPMPIND